MDQHSFDNGKRTPTGNRQLVVLDRNVEPVLGHSGHFDFKRVAISSFNHARRRRDKLFGLRAVRVMVFTG